MSKMVMAWIVSGIIVASLIFGALQGFLLRKAVSEQSEELRGLQQRQSELFKEIQDTGNKLSEAIPDTRQILRDVLAGGDDVSAENPLPILKQQSLVKRILVDSDVKAHPQTSIGGFNHPVQTYHFHQYVVFVDHDDEIKFAKRQIGDAHWNIFPTGITQTVNDNHVAPHFNFDKNGHIIFFYNTYGGITAPHWRVSTFPEDPSSWEEENTFITGSDDPVFGEMPFIAGQTVQMTRYIPGNARFIRVTIENLEGSYAVNEVKVIATLR